ncbi:MAG TPA: hypothetical protein GXZ30_11705 [Propionibacterium sp.]|jgi:hypothetical protein|nr:hypothetical protein [Propionibacterium sp.]
MKDKALTNVWAVNIDQRHSRREADRVAEALRFLETLPGIALAFERTAGDEVQGLLLHGSAIVDLLVGLARLDAAHRLEEPGWRIGIGLGDVEDGGAPSTRAARGTAYLAARQAIEEASRAPAHLALRTADPAAAAAGSQAETALILLRTLLSRRTGKGWEVVDAMAGEATQADVAVKLGVSESAVSQRLARAGWRESVRGAELAVSLLTAVQCGQEPR